MGGNSELALLAIVSASASRRSRPEDFGTLHSGQRQERTANRTTQTVHKDLLTRLDARSMYQPLI
jgi:hypothetical protein